MQAAQSPATRKLDRAQRLARFAQSRGERFAARREGKLPPVFSTMRQLPRWMLSTSDTVQLATAKMTAILYFRRQIDLELGGAKLGELAALFGETLLDHGCSAPCPPDDQRACDSQKLPRPEQMLDEGWAIMCCALPTALARSYPGAEGNERFHALADTAFLLISEFETSDAS
jgi:hypothetical protein